MPGLQSSSCRWVNRHPVRTILCLPVLLGGLLIAGLQPAVPSAAAAVPSPALVVLGHASTYAALSSASVGNTVSAAGAPFTTLRGDLGPGSLTWNGKIKQKFAPRGTYKFIVQAVSPAGASVRKTGVARIT